MNPCWCVHAEFPDVIVRLNQCFIKGSTTRIHLHVVVIIVSKWTELQLQNESDCSETSNSFNQHINCDDPQSVCLFCPRRRSRGRNYEAELQRCRPEAAPVEFGEYHPLKPIMVEHQLLLLSCCSASSSQTPLLSAMHSQTCHSHHNIAACASGSTQTSSSTVSAPFIMLFHTYCNMHDVNHTVCYGPLMSLWQLWPAPLLPTRWQTPRPAAGLVKAAPPLLRPPLPRRPRTPSAPCWTVPTPCPCLPRPLPPRLQPCHTAPPQGSVHSFIPGDTFLFNQHTQ